MTRALPKAFVILALGLSEDRTRTAPCMNYAWSEPRQVVPDSGSAPHVARFPVIAATKGSTYVVGNDIPFFSNRVVVGNPLTAWKLGAGSIGRPSGRFLFVLPKAIASSADRLDLLWAEPAEPSGATIKAADWPPYEVTTVWTSAYERGEGWTKAKVVYEGSDIDWVGAARATTPGSSSILLLTAAAPDGFGKKDFVFLRKEARRWVLKTLESDGPIAYSSLGVNRLTWVVAYISSLTGVSADENSVFLRISRDGGESWSTPRLISRSGSNPAHGVKVLIGSDGIMHLVWRRQIGGGSRVQHVSSDDGGRKWSSIEDVSVPAGVYDLKADIDACNTIHVIQEDASLGEAGFHLDHLFWNGRWSKVAHLFPKLRSNSPDFRILPNGNGMLVFLSQPIGAPLTTPLVSLFAELSQK